MNRISVSTATFAFSVLLLLAPSPAQDPPRSKAAKGGPKQGEPWALVPETFQHLKQIPEWPLPTNLEKWQNVDREKTRATLIECLGELPLRPDPRKVRVLTTENRGDHTLEHFEFHNGVDMVVTGVLLIPKHRAGRVPAIIGLHGHGSVTSNGKDVVATNPDSSQLIGPMHIRKGYVVAAIDGYFHGDRIGKAPAESATTKMPKN